MLVVNAISSCIRTSLCGDGKEREVQKDSPASEFQSAMYLEKAHELKMRYRLRWISSDKGECFQRGVLIKGEPVVSFASCFSLGDADENLVTKFFPNFCEMCMSIRLLSCCCCKHGVEGRITSKLHFWQWNIAPHTLHGSNLFTTSNTEIRLKQHKTKHKHVHANHRQQRLILKSEIKCKGSSDG